MSDEKRLNIGAILIGFVVDVVGATIFMMFTFVPMLILFFAQNAGNTVVWENPEAIAQVLYSNTYVNIINLVLGVAFTVIGGYVAARLAKALEIKHALMVGVLSVALSLGTGLVDLNLMLRMESVASIIFTLPAALFGGYLRLKTKNEPAKPLDSSTEPAPT